MKKFRWGILGCGRIAHSFAKSLMNIADCEVAAVASRTPGKGDAFARKYGVPKVYTDYEALVTDDSLDCIYIATLHNMHYPNAMQCLVAGRNVLCEKPLTLNAREAREMVSLAREKKLFLMEAIWTRFMPGIHELIRRLDEGVIGEVRTLNASFGIHQVDPEDRWLNPERAGGALLDLGVYCLYFSHLVMGGWPDSALANAFVGETGVDEDSHYFLGFPGGRTALMSSSVRVQMPHTARIYGTLGSIEVENFFHPDGFRITLSGGKTETVEVPHERPGYRYEAEEVMRCIRSGLTESPLLPPGTSLQLMQLMDSLRAQWGTAYPEEGARAPA